jgi:hypothetical protein
MSTIPLSVLLQPLFHTSSLPPEQRQWAIEQFSLLVTGKTIAKLQGTISPGAVATFTECLHEQFTDMDSLVKKLQSTFPEETVEKITNAIENSLVETYRELTTVVIDESTESDKKQLLNNLILLRSSLRD